jgi:hypothetical protein
MSYLLGSEGEARDFTDEGITVRPDGLTHAVNSDSPDSPEPVYFDYAVCGRPVRVWPEQPFDPTTPSCDRCAALTHRT